jgi:hypothetical protein
MTFTPFGDRPLEALNASDLGKLRLVREGWYVEYKRELGSSSSIAKSISALANTLGGWIFYGVSEKSKSENVAGDFAGIPASEVEAALSRIRHAAADSIDPPPHFEVHVVSGPNKEIDLPQERSIIVVRVPESFQTPHIHSSGVIYRRVGDGSEPIPERAHSEVARLVGREDRLENRYRTSLADSFDIPPDQEHQPFARLILIPDIWRTKRLWLDAELDAMREVMNQIGGEVASTPFDTVYPTAHGYMARQLTGNDRPDLLGMTFHVSRDGISDIHIPFNYRTFSNSRDYGNDMSGHSEARRFGQLLENQRYKFINVIDLNFLFTSLVGLMNIQERINGLLGWSGSVSYKFELRNVARSCPFLDVPRVIDEFEKFGAPLVLRRNVELVSGYRPSSFLELKIDESDGLQAGVLKAAVVFSYLSAAFGLRNWYESPEAGADDMYFGELVSAAKRATDAQGNRKR